MPQGRTQPGQPGVRVLSGQPHAPGQRVAAAAGRTPMIVISSRSSWISGAAVNQSPGSRPANQPRSSSAALPLSVPPLSVSALLVPPLSVLALWVPALPAPAPWLLALVSLSVPAASSALPDPSCPV